MIKGPLAGSFYHTNDLYTFRFIFHRNFNLNYLLSEARQHRKLGEGTSKLDEKEHHGFLRIICVKAAIFKKKSMEAKLNLKFQDTG